MRSEAEPDDDDDEAGSVGRDIPLTDLFLTLGATFLFSLFMADPSLRFVLGARDPVGDLLAGHARLAGDDALVLLAGPKGVTLAGAPPVGVPLARIATDVGLADRIREGAEPLLVAVVPGGEEASFLLDPVIARAAPARRLLQIRLDETCAALAEAGLEMARSLCRRHLTGEEP